MRRVYQVHDGCGVPQVNVHPQEGGGRQAGLAMQGGLCALTVPLQRLLLRRGPRAGSGQGHASTWEHCVHLLVPTNAAEDTVSHAPQRWQVCGTWKAGDQRSRRRSQRSSHC